MQIKRNNRSDRRRKPRDISPAATRSADADAAEDVVPSRLTALLHACNTLVNFDESGWHELLAALPINTQDYLFLSNWLNNTDQLIQAREFGAARYQLRIVRARLTAILDAWRRMPAAQTPNDRPMQSSR